MRTTRPSPLTKRILRREDQRSREVRERAEQAPRAPLTPGTKVVDRDTVVELLTQLRDFLDSCSEQVNDLARITPSLQDIQWHDLSEKEE